MQLHFHTMLLAVLSLAPMDNVPAAGTFNMPGTPYSVDMPGAPDCEEQSIAVPLGTLQRYFCAYFDKRIARGYSIEYFALPSVLNMSHSSLVLRATMAGAAENSGSKVVEEREILVEGYPALEAVLVKDGFYAYIRYIFTPDHLITVTVDGGKSSESTGATKNFLRSFRIEPEHAPNNSFKPNLLRSTKHMAD